eukprot:575343-Heterocapsa_arctica.AAC.1
MQRDFSWRAGVEVPVPVDEWDQWEAQGRSVAVSRQGGRAIAALEGPYGGLNVPVDPPEVRSQRGPEEKGGPARYQEMAAKL